MGFWSACKDKFSHYGTWAGLLLTAVFAVLAILESTSQFTLSLVGLHNKVEIGVGPGMPPGTEPRVFYTASPKDIFTILAIHIPVYVIFSVIWDFMARYPSSAAKNQFCIYVTTGLMLASCVMLASVAILKEGYWTLDLWWNGLTDGHMSGFVKLIYLVLLALLSYCVETLIFGGQSFNSMLDCWINMSLNLAFSVLCFVMGFVPLLMVVFVFRCYLQAAVSFVQVLSLLELSGKRRDYTRIFFRVLRWLSGGAVLGYAALMVAVMIFGSQGIFSKACICAPLGVMCLVDALRVASGTKFDLDQLRAGDGGQGKAAPPAPAPALAAKSKAKRK